MKDEKLENITKCVIEKTIAHLESLESRIEHTVYSDDDYYGYQVGFYIYYDYGIKDYRIYASACNEEGFAARRGRYNREELGLNPDFVSALVDEYICLMKEADISEQDYGNRGLWEEEMNYSTSSGGIFSLGSTTVLPKPFECSVTDDLYESLWIGKEEVMTIVQKLVGYCKENRERHIQMHILDWREVECVLTCVAGYEIGVRIRYDAQKGGGYCPICRDEDGIYWQMETCSYCDLSADENFVEKLSDYYVFLLALQRGMVFTDKPIEKFSKDNLSTFPFPLFGKGTVFIWK